MCTFTTSWDTWETPPHGSEIVLCTLGMLILHQETADGERRTISLSRGEYAINEPGTWHTADVPSCATAVFITAGWGTEHRPRSGSGEAWRGDRERRSHGSCHTHSSQNPLDLRPRLQALSPLPGWSGLGVNSMGLIGLKMTVCA